MNPPSPTPAYLRSPIEVRSRLSAALIEQDQIRSSDWDDLQQRAAWKKEPIEALVMREGIIDEKTLLSHYSTWTGFPLLQSKTWDITESVVNAAPPRAVVHYRFMPLALEGDQLLLATDHVRDNEEEMQLRVLLGRPLQWVLCTTRELDELITHYYGIGIQTFLAMQEAELSPRRAGEEESGIPELIEDIIRDAIRSNATDIHVEPEEDQLRVRYRIDGVLYPTPLPRGLERYQRALISGIKVMAQLNIAERRLPQDGRMEKELDGQPFDIRVSCLPTRHGETIEMRILNRDATFLQMSELGMPLEQKLTLEELVRMPYGLLLFTGPTGSGKTTSLYAMLAHMNDSGRKIITLEDPVEYQMSGITQLQVHSAIGFTFAHGLRSVLRHDPDVILVGEIRDDETADIAISSALTGHLVLSTLHTNDSASAATRLIDMGIEPYLVASAVQGVIAQRLVRRLCEHCREQVPLDEAMSTEAHSWFPDREGPFHAFRGRGCPYCRFTGYHGRRAIYEILEMDDPLRTLIVERATATTILRRAMEQGLIPLRKAGWELVLAGETSIEDLLRVTSRTHRHSKGNQGT